MERTMDENAKEALRSFNEEQKDWYQTCPKCGRKVTGSLAKIKEHRCGTASPGDA